MPNPARTVPRIIIDQDRAAFRLEPADAALTWVEFEAGDRFGRYHGPFESLAALPAAIEQPEVTRGRLRELLSAADPASVTGAHLVWVKAPDTTGDPTLNARLNELGYGGEDEPDGE